jgi:hypothetical protein
MELSVLNKEGKDTGRKITLHEGIFGVEPSDHAIYLDVKQYMANKRQGTHKTKERAEVTGSTRKIKNKKEPVQHVPAILNRQYSKVAVPFSVRVPKVTSLS